MHKHPRQRFSCLITALIFQSTPNIPISSTHHIIHPHRSRDPDCLLAQLCNGLEGGGPGVPPLLPDPEGFYYFDRDWWLFRYLLQVPN